MNHDALPRVLFVDDEPLVLEGLRDLLRGQPFEVLSAGSAEEALGVLRQQAVDVVVTDERMPQTSGSELLRVLATEHPATARVILTGHATVEAAMRAINAGRVFWFLRKPCSPEELVEVLERALEKTAHDRAVATLVQAAQALGGPAAPDAPRPDAPPPHPPSLAVGAFTEEQMRDLSVREREVFEYVVAGYRVSQVAQRLFVSQHTVRNHLKAIFMKLGVHSQAALLAVARSPRR